MKSTSKKQAGPARMVRKGMLKKITKPLNKKK